MNAEQGSGLPTLCRNGCGFFSGVDSKGLCSVCFKEFVKKEEVKKEEKEEIEKTSSSLAEMNMGATAASASQQSEISSPKLEKLDLSEKKRSSVEPQIPSLEESAEAKSRVDAQEVQAEVKEEEPSVSEPPKKKKNRCLVCKKKLGLTGFSCRCGGLFCGIHRYSDKHECNFDYKAMGEKEIAEANPVVVAQKVAKI